MTTPSSIPQSSEALRGGANHRKPLSWIHVVVFSLLPVLLLLTAAEGGLRVYALFFRTVYERYNTSTGRLELVPSFEATLPGGRKVRINSKGFVGPEFADKKPAGVYRMFTIGDSCTFGGNWDLSYAALLQRELDGAGPRIEVINAGIEGYNSEYALGRLRDDVLKYEPDLVTIYIGWNDLMKEDPKHSSSAGRRTWLGAALNYSYLYKGLSKVLFFYVRPMVNPPGLSGDKTDFHAYDEYVPVRYRENLSAMVSMLAERNVRVLLLTRPTVVRPGMTAEDLKRQNVFFPYFPDAYSIPRLLSLHNAYNNTLRKMAAELNVPILDLDVLFNQQEKDPLFWDTMHPSEKGHELIARALLPEVKTLLPGR